MKPLYILLLLGIVLSSVSAAVTLHHCPINQVYKACKGCDLRCEDMGAFRICPKICIPGCACADGYVKNPDGQCVRQEDCPYPYKPIPLPEEKCSQNEEYKMCKGCDQICENLGKPVICTYECIPGCACKEGYIRHNGKCIQESQCSPPIPNDIVIPQKYTPDTDAPLAPRDTVPIALFPKKCPINEVFTRCKACDQGCPGIDPPVACTKDCRPGCSCMEGYVRHNGKCIDKRQCPKVEPTQILHEPPNDCGVEVPPSCPANQHFTDCLPCNEACPGFGSGICPLICKSGCACDPGFSRIEDGRCIPTIQCPQIDPMPEPPKAECHIPPLDKLVPPKPAPKTCPVNEEFTECGSCEPTCQSLREPTACLAMCVVGCQCQSGYVRENGVCIPAYQCPLNAPTTPSLDAVKPPVVEDDCPAEVPPSCPVNEHFSECLPCNEQCPGFGSDICLLMCQSGCACDEGFSRFQGKCIPTNQCPQVAPKPPSLEAIPVPKSAPLSVSRPDLLSPIPTHPVDQCPTNEVFSTCGGCEETCDSLFEPMICAAVCVVGCQCKPGYVREKGKCVDASFCPIRGPKPPVLNTEEPLDIFPGNQCPINEVFKECKSCDQTCDSLSDPLMCTMECVSGCSCLDGYVRDNGVCVPVSQCFAELAAKPVEEKPVEEKPVEEKPVEEKPVEEKPVEEKPVEEKPAEEKPAEEKPAEEKPAKPKVAKQCPVNEEFKSCKGCDHTCQTLHHPIMCSMICMPGCACKPGFVRKDGVCVEPSKCLVESASSFHFELFSEDQASSVELDMEPFISMFAEPQSSVLFIP